MADAVMMPSVNRRDRAIVLSAVVAISVVAWIYITIQARSMADMATAGALALTHWTAVEFIVLFVMWSIMMVGMMLPSAVPLILDFAAESRRTEQHAGVYGLTTLFALGYVVAWIAFSVVATIAQWGLHEAALLSPMMVSTSSVLSGILLLAAGVYQLTPIQYNLLKRCRQPLHFLRLGWRKGAGGAFVMGLEHGAYCLGCCFVLMGILFFGGVMNLLLLAAVTVFVLIEKALPLGNVAGLVSGPLMIAAGLYVLL